MRTSLISAGIVALLTAAPVIAQCNGAPCAARGAVRGVAVLCVEGEPCPDTTETATADNMDDLFVELWLSGDPEAAMLAAGGPWSDFGG